MKIGILGGTFDPIHKTHIEIAKEALKQFHLDKVWIMPTPYPPHKDKTKITDNFHRQTMIKLAVADVPNVEFSDIEFTMHETTYTADTLNLLKELHPQDEFYFIVGSDSVAYFMNWYRPDVILKYANLLVVRRNDESSGVMDSKILEIEKAFGVNVGVISMDLSDISSSYIRTHSYEEIKKLVPDKVYEYIIDNQLYNDEDVNKAWSVNKIIVDLSTVLEEKRFEHTMRVATVAKEMAEYFHVNPNKAYLAAILHDCAKHCTDDELLNICKENKITVSKTEAIAPYLLHAKVGAFIAQSKYGITDNEVLSAICYHTTGKAEMTKLEQIVFCADYIEPGRDRKPNLDFLRELSRKDLNLLTYHILKDTVQYLKDKNAQVIDKETLEAYNYYKEIIKS